MIDPEVHDGAPPERRRLSDFEERMRQEHFVVTILCIAFLVVGAYCVANFSSSRPAPAQPALVAGKTPASSDLVVPSRFEGVHHLSPVAGALAAGTSPAAAGLAETPTTVASGAQTPATASADAPARPTSHAAASAAKVKSGSHRP